MLEMKTTCQSCQRGLTHEGKAFICSYECTFCEGCSRTMKAVCPNCGGELLPRPRRNSAS